MLRPCGPCFLAACLVAMIGVQGSADEAVPREPKPQWWKGNIHTHSFWSDGDDFPEMIAEWYRTHDYNFLALSDHNVLSEGLTYVEVAEIESRGGPHVLEKYRRRFGGGWVETQGEEGSPEFSVRLKPLHEFRALCEERGKFILIPGEEISDKVQDKPVHLNATNLKTVIPPLGGSTVQEAIRNNLKQVEAQARESGREILLHLNHPNFGFAVTAEDLAAVVQERFFEVYNGHPKVHHEGNADHPGVERLWDIANTIRLGELKAPPLFGVATDDSHNYHGVPGSHPGRGWVMVRSHYLSPEHIMRAMKRGEFYASSGVTLRDVSYDTGTLALKIEAVPGERYTTEFVGTRVDYDRSSEPRVTDDAERTSRKYSSDVGTILATADGTQPRYEMHGDELYVRAVITSSAAHPDPSFPNQKKQAWTQPFAPTSAP